MTWQPRLISLSALGRIAIITSSLLLWPAVRASCDSLSDSTIPFRSLRSTVGIYHWGGRHSTGFADGIRDLAQINARLVRIAVSPRMDIDYNRGSACIPGFSLSNVLEDSDLLAALSDPSLSVIMITLYDGIGFADCTTHRYLSPRFYTPENTAKLVQEYSDFVYSLHKTFAGSRKRFILSNWEGDNAVYCGQAHRFAVSMEFRQECLELYPGAYAGNSGPHETIEGMILWLNARYRGVAVGRERARREGMHGIDVFVAPEFCAVRMLRDQGLESVLFDVVPRVSFDYVSYSSYESLNSADPGSALRADLDLIRAVTRTGQIILGEVGFARSSRAESQVDSIKAVTRAALCWGVAYIFQWNLYDQSEGYAFGLFDTRGEITHLGRYYRDTFQQE